MVFDHRSTAHANPSRNWGVSHVYSWRGSNSLPASLRRHSMRTNKWDHLSVHTLDALFLYTIHQPPSLPSTVFPLFFIISLSSSSILLICRKKKVEVLSFRPSFSCCDIASVLDAAFPLNSAVFSLSVPLSLSPTSTTRCTYTAT